MAVDDEDERPLLAVQQLLEACLSRRDRADRLRARLYACRPTFVAIFQQPVCICARTAVLNSRVNLLISHTGEER